MFKKKSLILLILFFSNLATAENVKSIYEQTMDRFLVVNDIEITTESVMNYSSIISDFKLMFNDELINLTCENSSYEDRIDLGQRMIDFTNSIPKVAYFFVAPDQIITEVNQMINNMTLKISVSRSVHQNCMGNAEDYALIAPLR